MVGEEDEEDEEEGDVKASYYILNVKDKAVLKNGYRCIKELLLQHHNYIKSQYVHELVLHGIHVYSEKTHAFVTDTCDVEKAEEFFFFILIQEAGRFRNKMKKLIYLQ